MDAEDIKKKFSASKGYRSNWEALYKSAYQYFMPQRAANFSGGSDGANNDGQGDIYDSAPLDSLNKAVSKVQSSITPPHMKWARLKAGVLVPEDQRPAMQLQADKITDVVFSFINRSNFAVEISESYYDLLVGTGCLMMLTGNASDPFTFKSVPLSELYIEKVGNSKFGNIFREHQVVPMYADRVWPDAKVSKEMSERDKPENFIEYVEDSGDGKFGYYVVSDKDNVIIVERELSYNPFIIFRWSVMPGEVYGRGPVLFSLPDAKSLNKTKELVLKNASIAVSGVWTAEDDGVLNPENVSISPGAIIPVSSNGGTTRGRSLDLLPLGANFNVGDMVVKDLRESIYKMMLANPMGDINTAVRTATEMSYRAKDFAELVGSTYGRLQTELINKIINNALIILDSFGKIDLAGFKLDGQMLSLDYTSPLAMNQSNEEVNATIRFFETIGMLMQNPIIVGLMNEQMIFTLAEKMGVDASALKSKDELEVIKQNLAAQTQQQQGGVDVQQAM